MAFGVSSLEFVARRYGRYISLAVSSDLIYSPSVVVT